MKPSPSTSDRTTAQATCSVCGRRFYLDETDAPPFCSPRCKMIDLGRWLDEEISLPHEGGLEKGESTDSADEGPAGLP